MDLEAVLILAQPRGVLGLCVRVHWLLDKAKLVSVSLYARECVCACVCTHVCVHALWLTLIPMRFLSSCSGSAHQRRNVHTSFAI